MHIHITKDGKQIPLNKLELNHLKNIIKVHRRMSKEGVVVRYGSAGFGFDDDCYYDEDVCYGDEALEILNHHHYLRELKKRGSN